MNSACHYPGCGRAIDPSAGVFGTVQFPACSSHAGKIVGSALAQPMLVMRDAVIEELREELREKHANECSVFERQIDRLRAQCGRLEGEIADYLGRLQTAHTELAEAVALVRGREWLRDHYFIDPYCPWCFGGEPVHEPECPAAAILAKHEGGR